MLESDFVEKAPEDTKVSQEDLKFLTKMKTGIRHKEDGHFEMPLPVKSERPNLPNNKACAIHRLKCLEKRLKRNKQYYMDYKKFMDEILAHGDAERVPEQDIDKTPVWYIPHHGVYHPQKPGKIRVVFDASAKFQGTSLNDHLLTGPELTNTLLGVLCRFRRGPVAFMCDIERMFHQFHVHACDQDYLRFLWWENGDLETPFTVYRMKVHLFGAASSPGCANYGLKHLAAEGEGSFDEETIKFIKTNFYVDDGLASVDTEDQAIQLVNKARKLCSMGKLRLHKFISNSTKVLASLPKEECAAAPKDLDMAFGEVHMERALGVQWCVASDQFQFRVVVKEKPLTRRGVLATVASVFDPLGFVSPFILLGKQILQQMCRDKLSWDDNLPDSLRPQWEAWLRDLGNLADVKVHRCYIPSNFKAQHYELHHFADASASGYGMCTYLRAVSTTGEVHCSLVMGRSRVPPTKVTTIPRLELSAAVVAVRTGDMLKKELEMEISEERYWTDSKVVLGYLSNEARRFHVFVANRVERIKQSTDSTQWRYVTSEDNPADHASRGLTAEQLVASNWFKGPDLLWQKVIPSGEIKVGELSTSDPEVKNVQVHKIQVEEQRSLLDRLHKFSDWSRMIKAVARLKRYVKGAKDHKSRSHDISSLQERKEAELTIIKMVQETAFAQEIKTLQHHDVMQMKDKVNKLHKLCPFLDDQGILRVGGRLTHAALHPNVKHPAILPRDSHVSALLVKHYHEKTYHQGRGITMNELRANGFWILGCSKIVSSYIYKCVKCRRFRRRTEQQKMADLPEDRMETTPPFTYCGMDCFGPFYVKEGRKELKRYGLLITCMCSRAVHLEMLDDLSTDSLINSLRAFVAIRGTVRQIRCDQGTNFVGTRNEFLGAFKEMDQAKLGKLDCEFFMNTPASSHMGGVWERQIRTIRSVLTSILEQSAKQLDSSSLRTFLYEVMAVINSRPLTTDQLCDPSNPEPLTPNHILTMKSTIISPPPGRFVKEDLYLRKRWRRVQLLANTFWTRWKKEYLLNLQGRQKWTKEHRNAKINDVVLLKDEITPRNQWKLARIIEVYPGKDGKVRKMKLLLSDPTLDRAGKRTSKPVHLERPIQKTVILMEAEEDSSPHSA
ncbi:lysophosphatidylglycerol acyltransferase 1 [Sarotherodon galilaeus]